MLKRDIIIFFAGALAFHTLSHALLPLYIDLPLKVANWEITAACNIWITVISGIFTLGLLWWAKKLSNS